MQSSRRFDSITAVLLAGALAACGSNERFATPGSVQPPNVTAAGGGAFTARHDGYVPVSSRCTAHRNGRFEFSGDGFAKFFHKNWERGSMTDKRGGNDCSWSGTAMLSVEGHAGNSITVTLRLANGSKDPCAQSRTFMAFVVTSGTGRFAHATGSGSITFECLGSNGYHDDWSGTITF
ncbi:MAG TPA: hypothetical protein VFF63_00990 [Candidatus Babeliales bacterium]|nr:hypothetical protein [Candidatus Babeliales bacterium]